MNRRQRIINKRIVTKNWGRKCRASVAGCAICEAWRLYRESGGRAPTFEEVSAAIDASRGNTEEDYD